MEIPDFIKNWNVTADERASAYVGSPFIKHPFDVYLRGIDVDAPPDMVFRWVCQLKVAPYSYDWIDHWGRRSPVSLTPGVDSLDLGQRMLTGRIVSFKPGREVTCISSPGADTYFGEHLISYRVTPDGEARSRLLGIMAVPTRSRRARLRSALLGAGDLVMMRKQLLTLKHHAESQYGRVHA